jgi:nucleoside-diphosphate-sugar epimerase
MTSLVTGASGFIGGRLAQMLVEQGEAVRILARKSSDLSHLAGLPIEIAYGSLEDVESLKAAVTGCRFIYHCAAVSTDWAPWETFYRANVLGVKNLLAAAGQLEGLERFVHISTSDVYGYPPEPCDETHPFTDIGLLYGRSKIQGEQAVWEAYQQHGLPVTIFRPAAVYGPRGHDFVYTLAQHLREGLMPLFDGGRAHAGLLYVDNCVKYIIRAAQLPIALGQAYTLRDESDETWREYLNALADGLHCRRSWLNIPAGLAFGLARLVETTHRVLRLKSRPALTRHGVLIMVRDEGYFIDKAKRDLGFRSDVSFAEGVARSVAWARTALGER